MHSPIYKTDGYMIIRVTNPQAEEQKKELYLKTEIRQVLLKVKGS